MNETTLKKTFRTKEARRRVKSTMAKGGHTLNDFVKATGKLRQSARACVKKAASRK